MNNRDRKNKKSSLAPLIIFGVAAFTSMAGNVSSGAKPLILLLVLAVVTVAVFYLVVSIALKKGNTRNSDGTPKSDYQKETAKHFEASAARAAGKYDAYDHDTAHRLEQLDSFLKNGIVDKTEYKILKERYTKGV